MNNAKQVARLVTLIKERLNLDVVKRPGKIGEFEVLADGESIAKRGGNFLTRSFGAGYPDLEEVIAHLAEKVKVG
jgi:hypothetical protein